MYSKPAAGLGGLDSIPGGRCLSSMLVRFAPLRRTPSSIRPSRLSGPVDAYRLASAMTLTPRVRDWQARLSARGRAMLTGAADLDAYLRARETAVR